MNVIRIIVEERKDGFSAYIDKMEDIYAIATTMTELKSTISNAIRLFKEKNTEEALPEILKGQYRLVYV
ncbi:hypothetical protein [Flavobacterium humi]|uniref:Type II toxin-antitoxin system HicB family antitoxin n=1 Tax=Flavobacterium humi TaxID=2562683 RepID=A0A4Z0LC91_9FLAO|nr:hypothetical protein [Flavobacterium humi]TGD59506.1 hypothetical protein E4635_00805 [Flavobacterium humi]